MVIERKLQKTIEKYLDNKEAIVLTGARQVGKTTLAREIFEKLPEDQRIWFDFESPLDRKVFEDIDYNDIYQRFVNRGLSSEKRMYIFIDEIQYVPEVTKVIKYLIDHYSVKFFVIAILKQNVPFYKK